MNVPEAVCFIEAAGVTLWLAGDQVRVRYADEDQRQKFAAHVAFLRDRRTDVVAFLEHRDSEVPMMPQGLRLLAWNPKQAPITIEAYLVVSDSVLFAKAAIREIGERLANPKRKYGRPIEQLVAHLGHVGVLVALDPQIEGGIS